MDKKFKPQEVEKKIYEKWERSGAFKAKAGAKPYTILMPPPNANASLHAGHAMYVVEDVLVRYKRMRGYSSLWIPGTDHAGFETQFVYEKELAKKGKSRLDFDRDTLYQNVYDFVKKNSALIFEQFKRLGFSADWDRSVFTLDAHVVDRVFSTFQRMEKDRLVYRDDYIVNYCSHCGTSLAELEVNRVERTDPLYYIKYPLVGSASYITVATTRPETMFGDTALAVHPEDKKYKSLVGEKVKLPLTKREIPVIADEMVDREFGTGVVKITPSHDPNDFEAGKRHNLEFISVVDLNGRMKLPSDVVFRAIDGETVKKARERVVEALEDEGLLEKVKGDYVHAVTVCYKCKRDLEPTTIPNWFIKVKDLKEPVKESVRKDKVKFFPKRFKKHMLTWLDIMHDWPISRQIVWGIRIPAWYDVEKNPNLQVTFLDKNGKQVTGEVKTLLNKYALSEMEKGLQSLIAPKGASYRISKEKPGNNFLQETDTFDTWFSSGQWPLVVLKEEEYKTMLPTDTMGTLSGILKFWVSRMVMFTLYLEKKIPFKNVYLWSMVTDAKGVKMSKSKGNVINPIDLIDKYGADALRFSLLYGTPAGSKVALSDDKVRGMRNFANKIWNVARFTMMFDGEENTKKNEDDKWIRKEMARTVEKVTKSLDEYCLNEAADELYDFIWHKLADVYIEKIKDRRGEAQETLEEMLKTSLKLLHPFMPFVTETVWGELGEKELLITSLWPGSAGEEE